MANQYFSENGQPKQYNIQIANYNEITGVYNPNYFIDISNLKYQRPHLIIIPGMYWKNWDALDTNEEIAKWVVKQYQKGCEIASLCTGSFFLSATGLLNGLECSTHWKSEAEFRMHHPQVNLSTAKIITDHKGLYTSGGAYSSLNLILYLIEKYNGRQASLYCAKVLQIDIERSSQSPFILFDGLKEHDDDVIKNVQTYIEKNFDEKLGVEFLADKFNMSKRNFIRRFKKVTYTTPIEYIQKVKMEKAKRGLEANRTTINEIMYSIGYADQKAFRAIFRKVTGLSPTEYRQKFGFEKVA